MKKILIIIGLIILAVVIAALVKKYEPTESFLDSDSSNRKKEETEEVSQEGLNQLKANIEELEFEDVPPLE